MSDSIRIVGIDLAVSDKGTAFCEGHLLDGQLIVEQVHVGSDDEDVLKRMRVADWCGIDAPFGWPDAFVAAVPTYSETGRWPKQPVTTLPGGQTLRSDLRLRETDRAVQVHTASLDQRTANPLSVSTDKIASVAMRTAYLLTEFARHCPDWRFDRTGTNEHNKQRLIEVYPGASLACWGIDRAGYKGTTSDHLVARRAIRDALLRRFSGRLSFIASFDPESVTVNDHALDAFISFLTTAEASRPGGSILPTGEYDAEQIGREGWIHLPAE